MAGFPEDCLNYQRPLGNLNHPIKFRFGSQMSSRLSRAIPLPGTAVYQRELTLHGRNNFVQNVLGTLVFKLVGQINANLLSLIRRAALGAAHNTFSIQAGH